MASTSTNKAPLLMDRPLLVIAKLDGTSTPPGSIDPGSGTNAKLLVDCTNNDGALIESIALVQRVNNGSAGAYTFGAEPHSNPRHGDRWMSSITGRFYTYTDDGNSKQWLEHGTSGSATSEQGGSKSADEPDSGQGARVDVNLYLSTSAMLVNADAFFLARFGILADYPAGARTELPLWPLLAPIPHAGINDPYSGFLPQFRGLRISRGLALWAACDVQTPATGAPNIIVQGGFH